MYIFFNISLLIFNLGFSFLADESTDEEVPRPRTKEEEDIDYALQLGCKWGAFLPDQKIEAQGLLLEVGFLSLFCFLPAVHMAFYSPYIFPPLYFCFLLSFRGLDLLKRASSLREEAHRLEAEAQCL